MNQATFCSEQKTRVRFKQDLSDNIVERLRQSESKIMLALAERVQRCANPSNVFVADDFHTADGESYQANGSLWACSSLVCQNCVGRLSRKNRKIIRYVMANEKLLTGENWYAITPTMPDALLYGYSLDFIGLIYQKAFEAFTHRNKDERKQTPYQKLIRGMFKNCEFTAKENNCFHFHSHLLAIAKAKIQSDNFFKVRQLWTKAVRKAFEHYGINFECRTSDKQFHAAWFLFRHVRYAMRAYFLVGMLDRARFLGLLNVNVQKVDFSNREKTIAEISKYVTKSDSWENIPLEEIEKIIERPRRARMFEALGACRDSARRMREEIEEKRRQFGELQAETKANTGTGAYLDTKELIPRKLLKRKLSWRARIKVMTLAEYRLDLETEIARAQEFRRQQLRHRFPCATFESLDGVRWFGVSAQPLETNAGAEFTLTLSNHGLKLSTFDNINVSLYPRI